MGGWMDVGKLAQLGCTVTHYILLATPPQKTEGSEDQPKPVSLNHNPSGIHLAIMCWIPNIMTTDVLTSHCPLFPTLVFRSSSKLQIITHQAVLCLSMLSINSLIGPPPPQSLLNPPSYYNWQSPVGCSPIFFFPACQFLTHTLSAILGPIVSQEMPRSVLFHSLCSQRSRAWPSQSCDRFSQTSSSVLQSPKTSPHP